MEVFDDIEWQLAKLKAATRVYEEVLNKLSELGAIDF